jgi:hypothetical protein
VNYNKKCVSNIKITEHRAIFQRERQDSSVNKQTKLENWEHRNGPYLVQAFPKKWWVESDFTAPNLPFPLRLKGSVCHYNSIFTILGQIRYNSSQRSTLWKSIVYYRLCRTVYLNGHLLTQFNITSRNWFVMQGPVAIILISWNVIFIWVTGYWTRAIERFALFDLLKSYIPMTRSCRKIFCLCRDDNKRWIFIK